MYRNCYFVLIYGITLYTHFVDAILVPVCAIYLVLGLAFAIHHEGKPSKMHLALYQVINWLYQCVKTWDFTRLQSYTDI